MAAPKPASKAVSKGKFICSSCETEFTGAACPECGNKVGNKKLAPDGIEQQFHKPEFLLGFDGDPLSDEYLISLENAKMATEEFKENIRQSQVNASEVKRLESERRLIQKRNEVDRVRDGWSDTFAPGEQPAESPEQPFQQPLFGAQSPQAQFMSQLMRMDGEKRAEFMEQLSDADPAALNTLSGMFIQPQNPMSQQSGNPGQFPGMYPPWMMQQQPQQEPQQQESTTTVMREMFGLMKEMQPEKDNSAVDIIRELKDEIKSLHTRIDSVGRDSNNAVNTDDALIQYVKQLEKKIENAQYRPTFSEQARELKETIHDLETIGLVNNNTGDMSIDDKIRMKQLDHDIEMESKQFQVNQDMIQTDKNKQKMREEFTKSLFTQSFNPVVEDKPVIHDPATSSASAPVNPFMVVSSPKTLVKPDVVVDTIQSDDGIINEIRSHPVDSGKE